MSTVVPTIVRFAIEEFIRELPPAGAVPVPIGEPIPKIRSKRVVIPTKLDTKIGVWECSPGRFRRQVVQAEFCHFLEGECTFTPDAGEAFQIRPGDVVYFPPKSSGVWEIKTASRKVFMVFDSVGSS